MSDNYGDLDSAGEIKVAPADGFKAADNTGVTRENGSGPGTSRILWSSTIREVQYVQCRRAAVGTT